MVRPSNSTPASVKTSRVVKCVAATTRVVFTLAVMHVTDVRAYSPTVTESKSYSKYQSAHHGNGPWLMNINNRSHRAAALQPEPSCFVVWQLFKTLHSGFLRLSWGTFVLDIREGSHDVNLPALICTWLFYLLQNLEALEKKRERKRRE